ncbi:MAG TPA: polysaccharide deacetylase family protein [Candidatus Saccharimonadales bacterium]|nr:polysaccharide deacetylase family protein [Candidatus Saccharimonadales bacterium]
MRAHAAGANLIANPSLETASGSNPANWQTDNWGTNTAAFSYKTTGFNSGHSAYVSMTKYTNGDAKWVFDPVTVSPNTTYTFSESYQSNVATHIVAESLNSKGAATYFDVDVNVAASASAWKTVTYSIKTKAATQKLTILHLLEKVGWLQTDNFSLVDPAGGTTPPPVTPPPVTPPPVTPPVTNGLVPNPSVETVSPSNANLPTDWSHSSWGTNTPTYQYIKNDGHDGTNSVKVTMGKYTDGDAKWVYTPQALTRGADYRFTGWYKTNTIPHVVAQYIKDDGSEDYFGLPDPEPAANSQTTWQKYSDVFGVPQDVKAVSLFFFLSNTGWVQTDDYSVAPYTYTGFNRGLISLTFDDGFEENITTALPVLDQYGFKATHCFATQYVEGLPTAEQEVKQIAGDGQEVCAHTVTHPWLTQDTTADVDYELQHSQQYLQQLTGQTVKDFASPYGDYNQSVNTEIKKFYQSHRTTDEGFNSKDNFNPYRLRVQNMGPSTTLAQFQGWVNKAKADHTWLILIYHVITNDPSELTPDEFNTAKPDFDAQMQWLSQSGITVERWDQALAETSAQ